MWIRIRIHIHIKALQIHNPAWRATFWAWSRSPCCRRRRLPLPVFWQRTNTSRYRTNILSDKFAENKVCYIFGTRLMTFFRKCVKKNNVASELFLLGILIDRNLLKILDE